VGSFRAAEFIANRYKEQDLSEEMAQRTILSAASGVLAWIARCREARSSWQAERAEFQERMTRAGAHIRSVQELRKAASEAWGQWRRIEQFACSYAHPRDLVEALRNRQLCYAHAVYLEAILYALESRVGSRGSAIVLDPDGIVIHEKLGDKWHIAPEEIGFREKVLETVVHVDDADALHPRIENEWVDRRPIPKTDAWFETEWARFRGGQTYEQV
jgi:hypothetical protein